MGRHISTRQSHHILQYDPDSDSDESDDDPLDDPGVAGSDEEDEDGDRPRKRRRLNNGEVCLKSLVYCFLAHWPLRPSNDVQNDCHQTNATNTKPEWKNITLAETGMGKHPVE